VSPGALAHFLALALGLSALAAIMFTARNPVPLQPEPQIRFYIEDKYRLPEDENPCAPFFTPDAAGNCFAE